MNDPEVLPIPEGLPATADGPAGAEPLPAPVSAEPGLRQLFMGVTLIWAAEFGAGVGMAVAYGSDLHLHPWSVAGVTLLSNLFAFLVAWYFLCKRYERSLRDGFALRPVSRWILATSVLIGVGAAVVAEMLLSGKQEGESFMAKVLSTSGGLAAIGVMAACVPPLEEAYYRGFILPIAGRRIGAVGAFLVVTVWFTVPHLFQLAGDWIGVPIILVVGAIWTLQRQLTGSLVPSIICHFTYNACLILFSLLASVRN